MLRLWCVGFFLVGSKAEYTVVCETEQEAERIGRKLQMDGSCWPIFIWEL